MSFRTVCEYCFCICIYGMSTANYMNHFEITICNFAHRRKYFKHTRTKLIYIITYSYIWLQKKERCCLDFRSTRGIRSGFCLNKTIFLKINKNGCHCFNWGKNLLHDFCVYFLYYIHYDVIIDLIYLFPILYDGKVIMQKKILTFHLISYMY